MRSCVVFMPSVMPPSSRFSIRGELAEQVAPLRHEGEAVLQQQFACALAPAMSCPSSVTRPWRGLSRPNSVFSTVLLPAPLGPSSSVILPRAALKLRLLRIMNSP